MTSIKQATSDITQLCSQAFGPQATRITDISDVSGGRGAFSVVLRAELSWSGVDADTGDGLAEYGRPNSVVAKLPVAGANGIAAISSGAYRRESLAYREILTNAPISTPTAYAVRDAEDGGCSLLLQDLTQHRSVDQLDGLEIDDALLIAESLAKFHRAWRDDHRRRADLAVRRNTIAGLSTEGLQAGLTCLETVWADELRDEDRRNYAALVQARPRLAELFEQATDTLCHGDPRADNLVFNDQNRVVLFDWQQMALQFGEADLAWLAATSISPELRRIGDRQLVEAYGGTMDRYRLGMALPGLAVLFLAQRDLATERTRQFVAVSLKRIAAAIADLDVTGLAS